MRGLGWLLSAGLVLAGLAVPAYADDPQVEIEVEWPDLIDVAVPSTPYTFTVNDTAADPQGELYAVWQGDQYPIPHSGTHMMDFLKGGEGMITVRRCVESDCADTGVASNEITVWKESPMTLSGVSGVAPPGQRTAQVDLPDAPDTQLELTWELAYAGTSYADGVATATTNDAGRASFLYTVPAGRSGKLALTAKTSFDQPPFGPHRATAEPAYFDVDDAAPTLSLSLGTASVYPATDGYRDQVAIRYGSSEQVSQRVDVRNSAGTVVRTLATGTLGSGHTGATRTISWNGRDAASRAVPAGTYTVRFEGTDRVGRPTVVTRSVVVSHKKLVQKTWQRTFRASSVLPSTGDTVGRCSSLRRPARSDWSGSLGLHSRTKCQSAAASPITLRNRTSVPKAFEGRYGKLQIWVYGGGARRVSGGGSGARLDLGYRSTSGSIAHKVRFSGTIGSHAGRSAAAPSLVADKTGTPRVEWQVGVDGGSKYDVRSYTVRLTYFLLQ